MLRAVLLLGGAALLVLLLWRLGPSEILDALSRVGWYFVPVMSTDVLTIIPSHVGARPGPSRQARDATAPH